MVNVVGGKLAAFAVLEPLFADLIAADVKFPDVLRNTFEVLRVVDVDAACGREYLRDFSFLIR